jgi:phage shock protein A
MHDKLVRDINALRSRQATIKSNIAVAKATERVNQAGAAGSKAEGAMQAFGRFEQQAQQRLDKARALSALNEVPRDEAQALADLYKGGGGAALDDDLASLKAEMGLAPAVKVDEDLAALYADLGVAEEYNEPA